MAEMAVEIASGIRCGCGHVLGGDDQQNLLVAADLHVRNAHPDLVDTLSPLELARPAHEDEAAA
jgi:acetone carboxylase gamma subunit